MMNAIEEQLISLQVHSDLIVKEQFQKRCRQTYCPQLKKQAIKIYDKEW